MEHDNKNKHYDNDNTIITTKDRCSCHHIRKYLPDLMILIHEYWTTPPLLLPILKLMENLSIILQDEFRMYVPTLLPRMISFLNEAERSCDWETAKSVLETLETVGMHAESSLHMLPIAGWPNRSRGRLLM